MQVKLIEANNGTNDDKEFENEINAFILGKDIIDIKYSTSDDWYSALILYKEADAEVNIETSTETEKESLDPLKIKSPYPGQA